MGLEVSASQRVVVLWMRLGLVPAFLVLFCVLIKCIELDFLIVNQKAVLSSAKSVRETAKDREEDEGFEIHFGTMFWSSGRANPSSRPGQPRDLLTGFEQIAKRLR
jgi:hypothetical protein